MFVKLSVSYMSPAIILLGKTEVLKLYRPAQKWKDVQLLTQRSINTKDAAIEGQ
jgi:hypothetical protein